MRILVDRFIYQGFAMRQGDTPHLISPNAGLLQDQDEKRSLVRVWRFRTPSLPIGTICACRVSAWRVGGDAGGSAE
jgi:hypothetical protein